MTKRKIVKERDRELTMQLLLDGIATLVKERGFPAATGLAIAREAGRQ